MVFNQQPQYKLTITPVKGQFGCNIRQTINGKTVENPAVFGSSEEALRGGVDALGKFLGWL